MDIGRGAATGTTNNAEYLVEPKIGSPDIEGDLTNATITNPSGARSIMMEDIELVANIQTKEDKIETTKNYRGETDNWYLNTFLPNFMTKNIPNNNIQMPTLLQGIITNKPLFTYYNIGKTDPNIPNKLENHIFKNNYWMAGRYVNSYPGNSGFSVRCVYSGYVGGYGFCAGNSDTFYRYVGSGSVRPVVVLDSGVQLTEYTESGYNWKVDQN